MAVHSVCTSVLAHMFRVGIFFCTCVNVGIVYFPSEQIVTLHHRAHCVCFFSLTPDLQPHCDPTLLSDWPEPANLKAKKTDGGEKKAATGYYQSSQPAADQTHTHKHVFIQTWIVWVKYWRSRDKYT